MWRSFVCAPFFVLYVFMHQAGKFVAVVVECILISRMAYALGCSTQLVCLLQVAPGSMMRHG